MFPQNKVQHNPRKFGVKQLKARRRGLVTRFDWHRNANGRGRVYIAAGQMSVEAFNPSHVDRSAFSGRCEQSSIAWQLVTKMRSEDPMLFDAIAATASPSEADVVPWCCSQTVRTNQSRVLQQQAHQKQNSARALQ